MTKPFIQTKEIAFKIDFSDSLSFNASSAYTDAGRYKFAEVSQLKRGLAADYLSGYAAGLRIRRVVVRECKIDFKSTEIIN